MFHIALYYVMCFPHTACIDILVAVTDQAPVILPAANCCGGRVLDYIMCASFLQLAEHPAFDVRAERMLPRTPSGG